MQCHDTAVSCVAPDFPSGTGCVKTVSDGLLVSVYNSTRLEFVIYTSSTVSLQTLMIFNIQHLMGTKTLEDSCNTMHVHAALRVTHQNNNTTSHGNTAALLQLLLCQLRAAAPMTES